MTKVTAQMVKEVRQATGAGSLETKKALDAAEGNFEKVAFMGQVPVTVMGAVRTGDYIIADSKISGYGKAVHPEDRKAFNEDVERCIRKNELHDIVHRIVINNGEVKL